MSESMENLRQQAAAAVRELCEKAKLRPGQTVVVGCSTSEVRGGRIGTDSAPEDGRELAETVLAELSARKRAKYRPEAVFRWNSEREKAVRRMEQVAERLEKSGSMEEADILRAQLAQIVPAVWEDDLSIQSF